MESKHPSDSRVVMTQIVMPQHTNPRGTVFGGTIMSWVDVCGAVAARRHSRCQVVTASMDSIHFLAGGGAGDVICLEGMICYAGRTSMEAMVKVEVEDPLSGQRRHIANATLTFVAVDEEGRKQEVPGIVPETPREREQMERARRNRARRLEEKESLVEGEETDGRAEDDED